MVFFCFRFQKWVCVFDQFIVNEVFFFDKKQKFGYSSKPFDQGRLKGAQAGCFNECFQT
jgi:hypothetical protein